VGLILYYLTGLFGESQYVYERVEVVSRLLAIHDRCDRLATVNVATLSSDEKDQTLQDVAQLAKDAEKLAAEHREPSIVEAARGIESIALKWSDEAHAKPVNVGGPSEGAAAPAPPSVTKRYVLQTEWRALRSVLNQALYGDRIRLEKSNESIGKIFNQASRNLVSLTILAFVFIAVLIIVLPGRLVRPLRHITDVIRQAGGGKYDVEVQIQSHDEVGLLARTFRKTMLRVLDFDERKKDRIVEDGAKIDVLVRHMPMAAAIINRRYVIESANDAFHDLFELSAQDLDTPLPHVFSDGGGDLQSLFDAVVQHREPLMDKPVQLKGSEKVLNVNFSVDLCRNRAGDVGFLLVLVQQPRTVPSVVSEKSVANAKDSAPTTSD